MCALWRENKTVAIETLRFIRRNVMVGKPGHAEVERMARERPPSIVKKTAAG